MTPSCPLRSVLSRHDILVIVDANDNAVQGLNDESLRKYDRELVETARERNFRLDRQGARPRTARRYHEADPTRVRPSTGQVGSRDGCRFGAGGAAVSGDGRRDGAAVCQFCSNQGLFI